MTRLHASAAASLAGYPVGLIAGSRASRGHPLGSPAANWSCKIDRKSRAGQPVVVVVSQRPANSVKCGPLAFVCLSVCLSVCLCPADISDVAQSEAIRPDLAGPAAGIWQLLHASRQPKRLLLLLFLAACIQVASRPSLQWVGNQSIPVGLINQGSLRFAIGLARPPQSPNSRFGGHCCRRRRRHSSRPIHLCQFCLRQSAPIVGLAKSPSRLDSPAQIEPKATDGRLSDRADRSKQAASFGSHSSASGLLASASALALATPMQFASASQPASQQQATGWLGARSAGAKLNKQTNPRQQRYQNNQTTTTLIGLAPAAGFAKLKARLLSLLLYYANAASPVGIRSPGGPASGVGSLWAAALLAADVAAAAVVVVAADLLLLLLLRRR